MAYQPQRPAATYQSYQLTELDERGRSRVQGGSSRTRGSSQNPNGSRSPGGRLRQPQANVPTMSMTPQGQAQAAAQTIATNSRRGQTTRIHAGCWDQAQSSIVAVLRNAVVTSHKVDDYCGQPHGTCCVWCGRTCATFTGTMALGGLLLALDKCGVLNLFPQQNSSNNGTASATSTGVYSSSTGGPYQFQPRRTF